MLCSTGYGDSGMGAISTVGFKWGGSPIHRLDPRTKQIIVMVMSSACFVGSVYFLSLLSIAIVCCFYLSRQQVRGLLSEIKLFLLFLLFIFLVRSLTLGDRFLPVTDFSQIKMALVFCWRLLLVVLMGVMLMSTTRTSDIRAALVWELRPVPFVNERMAATMVGLVVRFLPLILFQAGEIGDAMKSRCIEERRSPSYRLIRFTIMLFKRTFLRADDFIDAMQARCYNEYRTMPVLAFRANDGITAGLAIVILLTVPLNWLS